jgi:hypothetical protein
MKSGIVPDRTICYKLKILKKEASMSYMREQFEAMYRAWPNNKMVKFKLENARDYPIGPHSYSLPRGEPKQCYMNATHLALELPHLTYVEGNIAMFGIAIEHAWCVDEEGVVVDTTLAPDLKDGSFDRISNYFGIPFRTDYVRKASLRNGVYGMLDYVNAQETLTKLIELGLEAGQQWLMDQKRRKAVRRGR